MCSLQAKHKQTRKNKPLAPTNHFQWRVKSNVVKNNVCLHIAKRATKKNNNFVDFIQSTPTLISFPLCVSISPHECDCDVFQF